MWANCLSSLSLTFPLAKWGWYHLPHRINLRMLGIRPGAWHTVGSLPFCHGLSAQTVTAAPRPPQLAPGPCLLHGISHLEDRSLPSPQNFLGLQDNWAGGQLCWLPVPWVLQGDMGLGGHRMGMGGVGISLPDPSALLFSPPRF